MPVRALALATVLALAFGAIASPAAPASGEAARFAGRVIDTAPRTDGAVDLRYRSISTSGDLVEQSAVLWLPSGPPSGHVVAWGHHTTGLADRCAPSTNADPYVPGLERLRRAGHVVVAPDYEGLGAPGEHPYLVGTSEARSVLDALRAARSVADAEGRSVVFGWSQGGHAALFAARLADRYAPDVRLAGVAAVAPVTDMEELLDGTSVFGQHPGFVALVVAGYATAYHDLDTTAVLPEAARAVAVAQRSCSLEAVVALQDTPTQVPSSPWSRRLRQNDPTTVGLDVPVLIVHGEQDELLAVGDAITAYRRLCALGTTVRLERMVDAGHGTLPLLTADDVVTWLEQRLAGRPLSGCAMRRS